jgi:hypothetical protein
LIMSNNRIGIFDIYKFRKKENSWNIKIKEITNGYCWNQKYR